MHHFAFCLTLFALPLLTHAAITNVFITSKLPNCEPHEEYRMIADACEPTCDQPEPACLSRSPSHRLAELPQCRCKSGFYRRDNGVCVALSECLDGNSLRRKRDAAAEPAVDSQPLAGRVKRDRSDGVDYESLHAQGGHSPLDAIVGPSTWLLRYSDLFKAIFAGR